LHRRQPLRRALDVGCGDGSFLSALRTFGAEIEVEGLEPDPVLAARGSWRSSIRVESLTARFEAPVAYDLIVMLDVLEHIEDDAGALRAVQAALRPGGSLLLTVPALTWLWSRHDEANQHFRRYEPNSLRHELQTAGFAVEELRFFFVWTVPPLLIRRVLKPARHRPPSTYTVSVPPRPVNAALTLLSRAEHAVSRRVRWPLGSSLLAIAHRPEIPAQVGTTSGRTRSPRYLKVQEGPSDVRSRA
jgi:SAM-dependent methyltransferase